MFIFLLCLAPRIPGSLTRLFRVPLSLQPLPLLDDEDSHLPALALALSPLGSCPFAAIRARLASAQVWQGYQIPQAQLQLGFRQAPFACRPSYWNRRARAAAWCGVWLYQQHTLPTKRKL